uniref:Fatty acyl-CoA reductase n=1 Tax=Timema bartmani TaxID=61472 RepID=A0A7R9F8Q0_9NEOP|nr:unnamed protein product [Timema bartmani]
MDIGANNITLYVEAMLGSRTIKPNTYKCACGISRVFVVLQLKHQIIKMLVESPQNEAGLDYSEIQKYYSGSTLLITGGTGFLGKVLIEKLLRSCPGIAKIYLLVRQKKGVTVDKRFTEQFSGPIFCRLHQNM